MDLFVNRALRQLQLDRRFQPAVSSLTVGRGETLYLRLGFMQDNASTVDDPDDAPAITGVRIVCKPAEGTQNYDENPIVDLSDFTRTAVGDEYFMVGAVPFTSGGLDKLLGVDDRNAVEVTAVQCVADVSGSLRTKSFRIPTGASTWDRIWFEVGGTGAAPAANTGETLKKATISANATASAVAASLVTLYSGSSVFTVTSVTDTATFTDLAAGPRGVPAALDSTFAIFTITAGKTAFTITDVADVDLNCWISYLENGVRQILPKFTVVVENNGMREGASPALYGGTSRTTTTAISSGTNLVEVTFATPFPHADYVVASRDIVNETDAAPLILFGGTIHEKTANGFKFRMNGDTDSANYVCESLAYLK